MWQLGDRIWWLAAAAVFCMLCYVAVGVMLGFGVIHHG